MLLSLLQNISPNDLSIKIARLPYQNQAEKMGCRHRLRKGVGLRILDFGGGQVDTSSATGKLMLTMFGAFGEFERSMMLERQREGIAKAKADGKYKGRAPTARAKADEVLALKATGIGPTAIAGKLNISRSSVHRIIRQAQPA